MRAHSQDTVKGTSTILFNLDSTEDYNVTVSAVGSDVCCIAVSFNIANCKTRYITYHLHYTMVIVPNFSPPDSANQVERVWATLDYPYENISSDMFSAQIVWTPLPGVTQYQVIIQNFELENIFVSKLSSISLILICYRYYFREVHLIQAPISLTSRIVTVDTHCK